MSDIVKLHAKDSAQPGRYLCFSLGKDKFAIPLLQVKEVIADVDTTNIPQAPAHFKGVMNLRGQVISIVDLRVKLKCGKPERTAETTIIILDLDPLLLGVVVDSVDSVVEYEASDISSTPETDTTVKTDYIMGVAKNNNMLMLLLDLRKALNADDYRAIKSQLKAA